MPESNNSLHFTWADVEKWVNEGLITEEQSRTIRRHVEETGPSAIKAPAGHEPRKALDMVTIAYYFGGFMILLAYTFFIGIQWRSFGYLGQFLISAFTTAILWGIGAFLRRGTFSMAGNILIFAGTGIIPLVAYTLAQALGIWPQVPGYDSTDYKDFHQTIRPYWVYLEVVSILAAVIAIRLIRFPLITMLIAFWGWYLSMDLARWVAQAPFASYDDMEQLVSVAVGAAMLLIGFFLQRRTREDYSRWLYLFGHLVLLGNLSALTYRKEGLLGLIFIVVYLSFVAASVWLQRPVFLVFGALGCYGYLTYLAYRIFEGSTAFPIALAVIGLMIVLTTVAYQKYIHPWLEANIEKYRPKSTRIRPTRAG
ncbi:MAG TPA: DUF2157 domain-containing protein [Chloroflexia bacterium]|nr:DUF2157 domain-containing protein [Chloroflexia bacterium]